eukprot:CAMPEP_0113883720 /NCGR_PEP_ID=MMETSP0780_2-20120614/9779_1 /TAXON_ID=652834 /ORGANISM="Palpitomonas bilix" /LENGTH=423 /DNA_ID=CAMNT_0000871101 /DNA_START=74 /DNA_END=1345 /DNA_ORIENTATION=+ /assembly_acc=CAM_ASM_000599
MPMKALDPRHPPKTGELLFDCNFECGNYGKVVYISEGEYDVFIRPDTENTRHRLWFYFRVKNACEGQVVLFNVVNFSKTKSLYRDGMSPVVRSESRQKWERIPSKSVFYYRSPRHKMNYVMSFLFQFDQADEIYSFAYCYPYSYSDLQRYLLALEMRQMSFFSRDLLTRTVQGRRLDLLTIHDAEGVQEGRRPKQKKLVVVTARVHPGESPASFICQGLIDFLVSDDPVARVLRREVVFKIIPMLNPDGVFLGNYRCSSFGFDLNRHWLVATPWSHPPIYAVKNMLVELNEDPAYSLDFYIDIHAHSTSMNGFMYCNIHDDIQKAEKELQFLRQFDANAKEFSLQNSRFCADPTKAGTGRRALGDYLDPTPQCFTLEVSFFGVSDGLAQRVARPFTEDTYRSLGESLGRTFADNYKVKSKMQK